MALRTIDLGPVSSYAIAVAHGYTGTEEQWYDLIHDVTTQAANAAQSAADAAQSAADAAQSKRDTDAAATQAIQDIRDEAVTQKGLVADEGTTQIGLVQVAESSAVDSVVAQQGTSVQAVYDKGVEQVAAVGTAGGAQIDAVEAKGLEVIASIPQDYTQLEQLASNMSLVKMPPVGTYTKLSLTPISGTWNFDTGEADAHATRQYVMYEIPAGTKILGIRGYQFNADNAAYGFYTSNDTLIYASAFEAGTEMADASPVGVPSGAAKVYVNIGTSTARGVWTFVAADVKTAAEQGLKMSNVGINNLSQMISRMPEIGDEPTKADMDNAQNGLVYVIGFTPTVSDFADNILHMPVRSSGVLLTMSRDASYAQAASQTYYATNGAAFVRVKMSGSWKDWQQLCPAVYYVGSTRVETSLVGLLKKIQTDPGEKIIYMDPGTYDIYADYVANEIPEPPDGTDPTHYDDYNVFLPRDTKLIGIGDVTLEFMPTSSQIDETTSKIWAPLNLWYGGNTVENIALHVKNCRYAIHDDSHSEFNGFTNVYRNIRIVAEANDTDRGMASATGFGFSDNSSYYFEDCDFELKMAGASFYGHEGGHGGAQVIVRNSVFRSLNSNSSTVRLQTIREQTALVAPVYARFEGCYIGGKLYLQSYKTESGQFFVTTLVKSGNPSQVVDYDPNPYPISVYE